MTMLSRGRHILGSVRRERAVYMFVSKCVSCSMCDPKIVNMCLWARGSARALRFGDA